MNQSVGRQYLSWQGIKRKHPLNTKKQPLQSHSNHTHKEKTADFSKLFDFKEENNVFVVLCVYSEEPITV